MSVEDINETADEVLDDLGEEAQNEQVESLVSLLKAYQDRLNTLEDRMNGMTVYLEHIEDELSGVDTSDLPSSKWGPRDKLILKHLQEEEPEVVSVGQINRLYKKNTDIYRSKTASEHTKHLLEDGPFEDVGNQKWRYLRSAAKE